MELRENCRLRNVEILFCDNNILQVTSPNGLRQNWVKNQRKLTHLVVVIKS